MRRIIAVILVLALLCCVFSANASAADPITMSTMGAITYAIAQASGMQWIFNGMTSASGSTWMENRINTTLAGRSLSDVVGGQIARVVAGKLVVPHLIYNFALEVIQDLISDKEIEEGHETVVQPPYYYGLALTTTSGIPNEGSWADWQSVIVLNPFGDTSKNFYITIEDDGSNYIFRYYLNQEQVYYYSAQEIRYRSPVGFMVQLNEPNTLVVRVVSTVLPNTDNWVRGGRYAFNADSTETGEIRVNIENSYDPPSVDVGYQWEGTIDGTAPDTNLDQLVGNIYQDLADNNLDVTGEAVPDQPEPQPSYPPVEPGDIDGYWNRQAGQMEGLGQDINSLDGTIRSQTDAITEAQEATTEAVESLTDAIEGALDVPDSEELPDFKLDLRELFPFCIPFDIYRLLSSFDAQPQAPHVRLPIVIDSIGFSYTLDLDFSAWNPVAQAMRTAELIVYAIALAWATGKVIKW